MQECGQWLGQGLISSVASISPEEKRRDGGRGEVNREIRGKEKARKIDGGDERRRKKREKEDRSTTRGIELREGPRYTQTLLLSTSTECLLTSVCYCCQQPSLTTLMGKVTFLSYSTLFSHELLPLNSPLHLSVSSTCMRQSPERRAHTQKESIHTHVCA